MDVVGLSPDQVSESALGSLGLGDSGVDLFSGEALAASVRRAASFLCPATPGQIIRAVIEVLEGLPGYDEDTKEQIESALEALVGYGDLLELPADILESGRTRLFLGAPAYVRRSSGACLLIGVRPDGAQLVGDDLAAAIEYEGHARLLPASVELDELLIGGDLLRLPSEVWLQAPRPVEASALVEAYIQRLQASGPSGEIVGAQLLDPAAPVNYYRGRWRPPKPSDNGTFVARRPQAYGADLWCFARVTDGQITQLVDLPLLTSLAPAAHEAWRLQAAVDRLAGHPQKVRLRRGDDGHPIVLDFFAPLPSWAQRRLDIVGTPLLRGRGALFSYALPEHEVDEELHFLGEMLWIAIDEEAERTKP